MSSRGGLFSLCFLLLISPALDAGELGSLPIVQRRLTDRPPSDYLIDPAFAKAAAYRDAEGKELILDNGLIRRAWRL